MPARPPPTVGGPRRRRPSARPARYAAARHRASADPVARVARALDKWFDAHPIASFFIQVGTLAGMMYGIFLAMVWTGVYRAHVARYVEPALAKYAVPVYERYAMPIWRKIDAVVGGG